MRSLPLAVLAFFALTIAGLAAEPLGIPFGTSPVIDGLFLATEWDDAVRVDFSAAEGAAIVWVHLKHDGEYLYLAYEYPEYPTYTEYPFGELIIPEILLDPDNAKTADWAEDDWWLHVSAQNCEAQGEYDDYGLPRPQPLLWGNTNAYSADLHAQKNEDGIVTGPAEGWESYGPPINTVFKFAVGSDPDDMSAMKMTFMPGFSDSLVASPVVFDPHYEEAFYCFHERIGQMNGTLFKWNWVEGGSATIADDWGDIDTLKFGTAMKDNTVVKW